MCGKFWEFPDISALLIISCTLPVIRGHYSCSQLADIVGAALCAFTLWAKTDAYRVVKDFAWCTHHSHR